MFEPAVERDAEAEDRSARAERFGGAQVAVGRRPPRPLEQPADAGGCPNAAQTDREQRPARGLGAAG